MLQCLASSRCALPQTEFLGCCSDPCGFQNDARACTASWHLIDWSLAPGSFAHWFPSRNTSGSTNLRVRQLPQGENRGGIRPTPHRRHNRTIFSKTVPSIPASTTLHTLYTLHPWVVLPKKGYEHLLAVSLPATPADRWRLKLKLLQAGCTVQYWSCLSFRIQRIPSLYGDSSHPEAPLHPAPTCELLDISRSRGVAVGVARRAFLGRRTLCWVQW